MLGRRVPVLYLPALNSRPHKTPAPSAPHLGSPHASSSAAAAAREAAPHARRAAALRRALQPGEARAIAGLGPSSPRATGPASAQGEETAPRAAPPPPAAPAPPAPCPPGAPRRRSPAGSRAAASWPPAARAPGLDLAAPAAAPSLGRSSALRELSRIAVATRRRKSGRGRSGSQSRLWSPCAHSPSRRGAGEAEQRARGPRRGCAGEERVRERRRKNCRTRVSQSP